ncbi:MAG: tRNA lysidine(34) synthetase TilS [Chloroflexota bacterium]
MQTPETLSDKLQERALTYIQHHALIKPGDCIVVAVSGGADSVCLLNILNSLRDRIDIKLHIAHLDHGLRGAEGQKDANYVKLLTSDLGLPATIGRADVRAWQTKIHSSLEEAAREARYRFMAQVAQKAGAAAVAVGHTFDDHVETVLLHIIRGTALAGLQGLQPSTNLTFAHKTHLRIIRPLLTITREETTDYCSSRNLNPRTDASNIDQRYLRNRVRLELLPLLRRVNPEIDRTIARLAKAASEAYSLLQNQTMDVWPRIARMGKKSVVLDRARMLAEPTAIQSELVRMAIIKLLGESRDFAARHFEAVIQMFSSPAGRTLNLPHQIQAVARYDSVILKIGTAGECPFPPLKKITRFKIPGITTLPGWQIMATVSGRGWRIRQNPLTAVFDMDATGDRLTISARQPGDRFQPLGMPLPKKLQDFMVDSHIPREWRDNIPLVRSGNDIIWVVGYQVGHQFRVMPATKKFLTLRFQQTRRANRNLLSAPANAKHST